MFVRIMKNPLSLFRRQNMLELRWKLDGCDDRILSYITGVSWNYWN